MGQLRSQKQEREHLVRSLRASGNSWVDVAEGLRQHYRVNARVAFRYAHGWSQRRAADEWNYRWPDELKTFKNFSYWELWPGSTGHAPSFDNLGKLAELYECAVSDLLVDLPDFRHLDVAGVAPFGKGPLLAPSSERRLGGNISTNCTPAILMRRGGDVRLQSYPRGQAELPNPDSLAEDQSQAELHAALISNREMGCRVLDEAFYMLKSENLFLHIDKIEKFILALCKNTLLASLRCDNKNDQAYILDNVVRTKERTLILKVRSDLQFDQLLHIVLQDPSRPHFDCPGDYSHTEMWLNESIGHYQGVRVTLPAYLSASLCEQVTQQIADEFTAGYTWLNERIQCALTRLGGAFEHDSLQLLRRQFLIHGRADLAHQLWLVKVADGRVTYAVDGDVATRVLHAGREFRGLQQAPASIACALLANSIPLDKSFSCLAIGESRSIDMRLTNTPYGDINEDFLVAQSAIYADQMLLTPLAGDRRGWLLAAYPSAVRADVASVLDATRADLEEYFSSKSTPMRSPVIRHPTQRLPPEGGGL